MALIQHMKFTWDVLKEEQGPIWTKMAVFLIRSSSWSGSSRSTKMACYNIQQTCLIYPAPFSEACQRHAVNAINFCSENPLNIITRMALSSILRKMLVHR